MIIEFRITIFISPNDLYCRTLRAGKETRVQLKLSTLKILDFNPSTLNFQLETSDLQLVLRGRRCTQGSNIQTDIFGLWPQNADNDDTCNM